MKNMTVRNVPDRLHDALEQEKRSRGSSLNQTVIDLLSERLGLDSPYSNGLARLAGGWTEEELEEFSEVTSHFERPDEDLWT